MQKISRSPPSERELLQNRNWPCQVLTQCRECLSWRLFVQWYFALGRLHRYSAGNCRPVNLQNHSTIHQFIHNQCNRIQARKHRVRVQIPMNKFGAGFHQCSQDGHLQILWSAAGQEETDLIARELTRMISFSSWSPVTKKVTSPCDLYTVTSPSKMMISASLVEGCFCDFKNTAFS